jgi:hypothetical protein
MQINFIPATFISIFSRPCHHIISTFDTLNNNSPTTCEQQRRNQPSKEFRNCFDCNKKRLRNINSNYGLVLRFKREQKFPICSLILKNICSTSLNTSDIIFIVVVEEAKIDKNLRKLNSNFGDKSNNKGKDGNVNGNANTCHDREEICDKLSIKQKKFEISYQQQQLAKSLTCGK